MRFVVQVEDESGWAVLSRGEHGQPRRELELLADRWRASLLFANAQIRVVADRPECPVPVMRAEVESNEMAEVF